MKSKRALQMKNKERTITDELSSINSIICNYKVNYFSSNFKDYSEKEELTAVYLETLLKELSMELAIREKEKEALAENVNKNLTLLVKIISRRTAKKK